MIDWRNGLTWVPIIVFTLFLVISFVIGLAGGYKRALFWTGGNLILWLIGFAITALAGNSITNEVAKLIKQYVTIEQVQQLSVQEIADAIRIYIGLIIYFLVALIGNLAILIPLYFAGYVRWVKIGKFDPRSKKYDAYVAKLDAKKPAKAERLRNKKAHLKMGKKAYFWLSRGVAIPASVVLAAPLTATMTQLAFGATVRTSNMYVAGSESASLKGLFDFTNWITSNIGPNYIGALGTNTSSLISGANLALNNDSNLQEIFTLINDCINKTSEYASKDSIKTSDMNSIHNLFKDYSNYVEGHYLELEPWLYDLSLSDQILSVVNSIIQVVMPKTTNPLTDSTFEQIKVFVDGILTGGVINTFEASSPNIQMSTYVLDWYIKGSDNYIQRLVVPTNVFNLISYAMGQIMASEEWLEKDPDGAWNAAKLVASLFFECEDFSLGKVSNLDIIISPNQIIADNADSFTKDIPSMDDAITELANKVISDKGLVLTAEEKAQFITNLNTEIKKIFSFETNDKIMAEIEKNSSKSDVDREDWGNDENPYIVPVDMFYTIDINELKDNYSNYLTINVTVPYTITVSQTANPIPCKTLDIIEFLPGADTSALWWSFIPYFNPIYAIPQYDVKITIDSSSSTAKGTKEDLDKCLTTNWYSQEKREYCSLYTAGISNPTLSILSDLSKNETDEREMYNTYKLEFTFYDKSGNVMQEKTITKYFKLSSFLKYSYPNPPTP